MADTRGVFRLKLAGSLKSKGEWVPLAQVFHNPSVGTLGAFNTGYFAGGGPSPSAKSTVDKMDFSTVLTELGLAPPQVYPDVLFPTPQI